MARDDGAHVLDAQVALDAGQHQIPGLPGEADDGAEAEQLVPVHRAACRRKMGAATSATSTDVHDEGPDGAGDGLVRARRRQELRPAENLAAGEGEHVVDRRRTVSSSRTIGR